MTAIVLYLIFFVNAVGAFFTPWIGIVAAYVISVMAPHNIWWWLFKDIRPFYWVMMPTVLGFGVLLARGKVSFAQLNTKLNKCMGLLWLCMTFSYCFGPYVHVVNEFRFYDPEQMFTTLQITFITYFIAVLLIDDTHKLKATAGVLILTALYMTYWANSQYLAYHKFGRLHGPVNLDGQGIYSDENNFAVLFVSGIPFLYYFGLYLKRTVLKWATWLAIPFGWHAIFLTASRGALLATGVTLLVFALRSRSKAVGVLVIVAFMGAFVWQAGDVMRDRSATITDYETEDSAQARLDAWSAAVGMMAAHPLSGVGVASFGQAFPDFSKKHPRVAHNTFFQIGGEWGVVAGITWLTVVFSTLNRLRKNGNGLRAAPPSEDVRIYYCLNEACLLGLLGFFVCSMFLSLQGYEVFYYLLVVANCTLLRGSVLLTVGGKASSPPVTRGVPRPRWTRGAGAPLRPG